MSKNFGQMLAEHERLEGKESRYTVVCTECGQDWQPLIRSPLWWRAKKKSDRGFLDALLISGKDCGCVKQPYRPEAPFRVIGYDDLYRDYDIPCDTFVKAINAYRERDHMGDIVFITGVSDVVKKRLRSV